MQFADDAAMEMALLRLAPLVPKSSVPAFNTAVCRLCQGQGHGTTDVNNSNTLGAASGSGGVKGMKIGDMRGGGGGPGLGKRKQQPSPSQPSSSQHGGTQVSSSSSMHHSSSSSSSSSSSIPSSQGYGAAAMAGGSQRSQPSKRAKLMLESAQGGSNPRFVFIRYSFILLYSFLSTYQPPIQMTSD